MNDNFEKSAGEAAAFQKICLETMSKMMQAAFTFTPNSPPPEVLRQIRNGIFQALSGSWEEFMRSPQFLDGMKQWMENAIAFRKISNDFMGRMRNEVQAPARSDIDNILLAVRHMEQRLLDRVDELSEQVRVLEGKTKRAPASPRKAPARARMSSRRVPANGKPNKP
ncbi:MAG: hypothetical protein ACREIC_09915 [Limisphaerales bacterium]